MNRTRSLLWIAVAITSVTLGAWLVTGRHYYTKFEVVEKVSAPVAADDPLAGTGFYDGDVVERNERRSEFHLGLVPTPSRLLDKHALSVLLILGTTWGGMVALTWLSRRRMTRAAQEA